MEIYFGKVEESIAVMKEVAAWGRSKGLRVWLDEWLTKDELITEDAQPENFCIGEMDGQIACAFILQNRDMEYWKNAKLGEAVYLHKLCVRREFAHQNIAELTVRAIADYCKSKGIKYIRLDTGLDEKVVRKIYLQMGFKIVDIIDYPNGRSLALYEMEV